MYLFGDGTRVDSETVVTDDGGALLETVKNAEGPTEGVELQLEV